MRLFNSNLSFIWVVIKEWRCLYKVRRHKMAFKNLSKDFSLPLFE